MIRVVIDTNILVSALLRPESLPADVLTLAPSGAAQPCISDAIFAEYGDVLQRPHLKLPRDVLQSTCQSIRKMGHRVNPAVRIEVCIDPDDNMFLECAEASEAHYLVTGNQRHFPERWKKTKVVGPRTLIELLMR